MFAELPAQALAACDADEKCERVAALLAEEHAGLLAARTIAPAVTAGRPAKPQLMLPRDVPYRGLGTPKGRVALVHAIAHIEFNAINLALDACCRFTGLPQAYYRDWIEVARDEARHFRLLRGRLGELGSDYGELPAHNGLWEAAEKTAQDVLLRMALVPRVLEARGLDVTPGMIQKLRGVRDDATADILEVILAEEVRHVAIGTQWFRWLCAERGLEPAPTFLALLAKHGVQLRPPINHAARLAAGFAEEEMRLASDSKTAFADA